MQAPEPPKEVVEVPKREEPRPEPASQPSPPPGSEKTVTVIGSGAQLEGNLVSAASLRIEGVVKGTVTAEGDVVVAPDADVAADIKATNVTIGGRYSGNIVAGGTLELTSTAKVKGNISCRSLVVNAGAIFSGESSMDAAAPAEPAKAATKPPMATSKEP
jgi:cytoskeletal protein CcmA (bactofilin family)